jgi:type II secretory pathway component GspD/PulD (secretin)
MNRPIWDHLLLFSVLAAGLVAARPVPVRAADEATEALPASTDKNPFALLLSQDAAKEPNQSQPPLVTSLPELRLETVVLKFLDAKSLKAALDPLVLPYGRIAVNEKSNSVVVCAVAEDIDRVVSQIRQADQMPSQVTVEVVILDVKLTDDTEVGVNWDLLSTDLEDFAYRQNFTDRRLSAVEPSSANLGTAIAYNTLGLGGEFGVISGSVRHVLHLIQQKRDVEILATPRALVVSGQSATIRAVEEIPYKEIIDTAAGGAAALTSTEFKEVGVTLQVQATVTDGNNIFLVVDTQQSVKTGMTEAGVPVVDTREANTSLLLQNGRSAAGGEDQTSGPDSDSRRPARDRCAVQERQYGDLTFRTRRASVSSHLPGRRGARQDRGQGRCLAVAQPAPRGSHPGRREAGV